MPVYAKTATRYCGTMKLLVRLHADLVHYDVSFPGTDLPRIDGIRRSPHAEMQQACDAEYAMTEIARTAMSFLADELERNPGQCSDNDSGAEFDESGNAEIRRRKNSPVLKRGLCGLELQH